MIGQVTLSFALLCGAGVLARTLHNLQTVDLGFRMDQVVLLTLAPESHGYSPENARRFFERLLEEARREPVIESAALSTFGVLSGDMCSWDVRVPGFSGSYSNFQFQFHYMTAGYFNTLRTPILQGRDFDQHDREGSAPTVIVSERFAKLFWPGQSPIGKLIQARGNREIVGVVKDSHYREVREDPPLTVYLPVWQIPADEVGIPAMTLFVRMRGNTSAASHLLRDITHRLDPGLPAYGIRSLETQRNYRVATERTMAIFAVVFAVLAMTIALVGLAGALAFGVSSRTREIGIRMVCGAGPLSIASIFIREATLLIALGLTIGLPLTWAALRALKAFVFRMPAQDPQVVASAILLFLAVGLAAVLFPLSRAARIDPSAVLRE